MSVHIGLMIWKEMKQQGVTVAALAERLGISKTRAQGVINSNSLDTTLMAEISEALNYNFFSYYETGKIFSNSSQEETKKSAEEIKRLKNLLSEKNKTIELKEKIIQSLSHTVSLLEKIQYR